MTTGTDKPMPLFEVSSQDIRDWDIMFCAVLAQLGSAIESLDQTSNSWHCLSENLASLQMLRQSALRHWAHLESAVSSTHSGVIESRARESSQLLQPPTDGATKSESDKSACD